MQIHSNSTSVILLLTLVWKCELERILDTGLNVTVLQGYNVLMRGPANVEETDRTYIYKIMSVIYCKAQATTSILYRL